MSDSENNGSEIPLSGNSPQSSSAKTRSAAVQSNAQVENPMFITARCPTASPRSIESLSQIPRITTIMAKIGWTLALEERSFNAKFFGNIIAYACAENPKYVDDMVDQFQRLLEQYQDLITINTCSIEVMEVSPSMHSTKAVQTHTWTRNRRHTDADPSTVVLLFPHKARRQRS